jgi:hypothetical protein
MTSGSTSAHSVVSKQVFEIFFTFMCLSFGFIFHSSL